MYDYTITVENLVTLNSASTNYYTGTTQTFDTKDPIQKMREIQASKSVEGNNGTDPFTAQFVVHSARKLLNSVQNDTVRSISNGIGQSVKYGMLGIRAVSGDVTAIASMVMDVVSELITQVQALSMQVAAKENSADESRVASGILDLNGVTIQKNWWSGRYEYSRK